MNKLTKRQRFIIASALIWAIAITYLLFPSLQTVPVLIALAILTYILSTFSINEDVKGIEYLTLFIVPVLFTIGTILFVQILPERRLYRYPVMGIFPVLLYVIFLTQNIFNVAAIRTIQLLRAARAVSYLTTLITAFFIIAVVAVQIENPIYTLAIISALLSLLTFQFYWSFDLGSSVGKRVVIYTLMTTFLMIQFTVLLIFMPVIPALKSLLLITYYYVTLGISSHFLERKLTTRIVLEYFVIACSVSFLIFGSLNWTG
jgi:hypothetical protein